MQISPIPTLDPEINETRTATANIVSHYIIPNEDRLRDYRSPGTQPRRRWLRVKRMNVLKIWSAIMSHEKNIDPTLQTGGLAKLGKAAA